MAFVINKIASGQNVQDIAQAIRATLASSRFTAEVTTPTSKRVEIRTVRLTYKKDYCGNHPLPCPVRPGIHKPHKRLDYLEGADWVGFNDMLNDVLDVMGCVCDCASSLVVIRKAGARCMRYDAQTNDGINNEWKKDSGVFEYHIKHKPVKTTFAPVTCIVSDGSSVFAERVAPHAEYPEGTPGFATAYGQPNYPEHHHA